MILTLVHVCSSTVIYGVIDFNFELFFSKTYFHSVHIFNFFELENKCK